MPVGTTRPDIVGVPLEVEVGRDVVVRVCVTVIVAESEPVVFVCGVMATALGWSACYIRVKRMMEVNLLPRALSGERASNTTGYCCTRYGYHQGNAKDEGDSS